LVDSNRAGVTFLDNATLLVHEVDFDPAPIPSSQDPDSSAPSRLHVSVLDATSGRLLIGKDWGTSAHNSSVNLVEGGVLLRTGYTLRLLSKKLVELQKITFREDDPEARSIPWDILVISVSFTGKTVLVNRISQKARVSHFNVLDGDTLKPRYSWDQSPPLYNSYSISDTAIVASNFHENAVIRTEFGGKRSEPLGAEYKKGCAGLVTFLSDNQLEQACKQRVLSDEKGPSELQKIVISQNGNLIANSLGDREIKKHIFSEAGIRLLATRIVVYDLFKKKRVLELFVDPLPKTDYDFALSPDGSRLAVLNDRTVSVFSVPGGL
jgi:hypothetical protein